MISPTRACSPCADSAAGALAPADFSSIWTNIGDVAEMGLAVWDLANRAKDRDDERLDAMRVHNGLTLDEFLAGK